MINDVEYGTGFAGSKKAAKMEAGELTYVYLFTVHLDFALKCI